MEMLEDKRESKISGPNMTVEVDESMFGHCKACLFDFLLYCQDHF